MLPFDLDGVSQRLAQQPINAKTKISILEQLEQDWREVEEKDLDFLRTKLHGAWKIMLNDRLKECRQHQECLKQKEQARKRKWQQWHEESLVAAMLGKTAVQWQRWKDIALSKRARLASELGLPAA